MWYCVPNYSIRAGAWIEISAATVLTTRFSIIFCMDVRIEIYLCWDEIDNYYYFGQKDDENIICWSSPVALNNFYAVAIKDLSVMRTPNLCPRCATLIRNKT